MLDQYIDHIVKSDNKSLLVRIYGLFSIQSSYFSNMDLILMENINFKFNPINIKLFSFDLKGSVQGRRDQIKKGSVLKCLNFMDINSSDKRLVRMDVTQIEPMYSLVEADAEFLKSVNVMDYSLLLVIEQITDKVQTAYRLETLGRNEYKSHDNSMIYHVGIIDFLQRWTPQKKMENFLRSRLTDQMQISCVNPELFQQRFLNFIRKEVLNKHRSDSMKLYSQQNLFDHKNFMNFNRKQTRLESHSRELLFSEKKDDQHMINRSIAMS